MPPSTADIRRAFIEYFRQQGHQFVPSSPTVPHDDPTLLFANAGMNQFKPLFLGQVDPTSPLAGLKRSVNSQKCIRAGGKHNDLEDVGKDTYHHTFFEMLGNWSFGDYFKAEAIQWAWELLTQVYKLPPDRIYATYFEGNPEQGLPADEEARQLWMRYLPSDRVLPGNMKDNFWEMGDTGPCGPCSEIHFDRIGGRDARAYVNKGDANVIEIWNLVFIQFDRQGDGSLRPLPSKHVDTGMGLERLVSVIQNKSSNYDTDVFMPLFAAIERITGDAGGYHGKLGKDDPDGHDMAYRVVADHIRTLTFAITDGAIPSNEGRGYVLRRILRRAVRYGRQKLGAKTGFLAGLVPTVVDTMSEAFPELRRNPKHVSDVIYEEEESFGRTLDKGIELFFLRAAEVLGRKYALSKGLQYGSFAVGKWESESLAWESVCFFSFRDSSGNDISEQISLKALSAMFPGTSISGEDAFKLYDTFGFPLDLTQLMAEERGLGVDVEGFEASMAEQKARSRAGAKGTAEGDLVLDAEAIAQLARMNMKPTDDSQKFAGRDTRASIRAIWNGQNFDEHTGTRATQRVGIILDKTSFYAEMGGQMADHGRLVSSRDGRSESAGGEFRVDEVRSFGGYVLHIGHAGRGDLRVGDEVRLHIESQRRQQICANHTATHMVNFALREVLGEHVDQKGSLVAPDRLRFDFSHGHPVEPEQIARVQQIVREQIARDLPVYADVGGLETARSIAGLRAVFGETYPDPVRVVSIGAPVDQLLSRPGDGQWRQYSVELCGGTHLKSTGEAQAFALVSEEGIAKGVRRITALTGTHAKAAEQAADGLRVRLVEAEKLSGEALHDEVSDIAQQVDALTLPAPRKHELRAALAGLSERVKQENKQAEAARAKEAADMARRIAESAATSMDEVVVATLELGSDRGALQAALTAICDRVPRSAVMLLSPDVEAGKVSVMAAVPKGLIGRGLKAGDWVREVAALMGGKGGGKPEQAQGAGSDLSKLKQAGGEARKIAYRLLG